MMSEVNFPPLRGAIYCLDVFYSNMLQSMDELIIAGTSSLSRAIKSIQCLRQHELCLRQHELPHHTWHTSPYLGKSKFYNFTPMFVLPHKFYGDQKNIMFPNTW